VSAATERPLPFPDRDSAPFWEGVRQGELRLQRCNRCGRRRWPPRAVCNACHSFEASWVQASGRGRVVSWVRTHQVFLPAFRDEVPYTVIQVALEEQPDVCMIGRLRGGAEPRAGLAVRAVFTDAAPEVALVDWEPR
jgi:hypothetical protein